MVIMHMALNWKIPDKSVGIVSHWCLANMTLLERVLNRAVGYCPAG